MEIKNVLVFIIQVILVSPSYCARTVKEVIPESPFVGIEGEKKQLHCILEASEPPAPSSYGNVFVYPHPPGYTLVETGKNITVTKSIRGLQAITTVTFNPLSIYDIGNEGIYCNDKNYPGGLHTNAHILPKGGVPKINFTSEVPNTYGAKAVLSCNAEVAAAGVDLGVLWYFYKWDASVGQDITGTAKMTKGGKSPVKTVDSALNVIVGAKTAGTYECLVMVSVQGYNGFNFTRNATVRAPVILVGGVKAKQKIKVYQKKDAVMVCPAVSAPSATASWKKGNSPIRASSDSRYKFSNYDSTRRGRFVIKDVDYKDRGVYTCNASNGMSFVTMEFTLRVRDPLGALWPFIGIVIEAIVLAVIIFAYERYKKSASSKKSKELKEKETSPLLPATQEPGVAYSTGSKGTDETVKLRPSDTRI